MIPLRRGLSTNVAKVQTTNGHETILQSNRNRWSRNLLAHQNLVKKNPIRANPVTIQQPVSRTFLQSQNH